MLMGRTRREARHNCQAFASVLSPEADAGTGFDRAHSPVRDALQVESVLDLGEAVRGDRRQQAAAGLGIVGEHHELGRDALRRRRAIGATNRRLCAAPPVSTPARASSSAPRSAGSAAASKANRVPDARAISSPWPSRPNPVTSVAAATPSATRTSEAARSGSASGRSPPRGRRADVRPWRAPETSTPGPESLRQDQRRRRVSRHPCGAAGRDARRRSPPARTSAPDRGSCGRRQASRRPRAPSRTRPRRSRP